METIKDLSITVTYRVGLKNVDVSDEVYKGLEKISERIIFTDNEANMTSDKDIIAGYDWLCEHINERDAYSWEHEINID